MSIKLWGAAALMAASMFVSAGALAQQCATQPVTVGFLPKLDTDPYFQVARQGAEEAQGEIGGKVVQQAPFAGDGGGADRVHQQSRVAEGRRHRDRR